MTLSSKKILNYVVPPPKILLVLPSNCPLEVGSILITFQVIIFLRVSRHYSNQLTVLNLATHYDQLGSF